MGQGGLGRDPPAGVILQELLRRKDKRLNLGATRVGRGTPFNRSQWNGQVPERLPKPRTV